MANEFKVKKGLIVDGSNIVVDVQGTAGQLFSVTDSLTGDLFSVSDVSGIPIFNVNSSGRSTFDGITSITSGGSASPSGVEGLHLMYDTNHAYIKAENNGTTNRPLTFTSSAYTFSAGNATFAGTLGIAGSSPVSTSALTIKSQSTSSQQSAIDIIQNGSGTNSIIRMGEKSTDGGRFHMFDSGTEMIAFYTDGTANHISAGNFGIGTNNATYKLQVQGTFYVNETAYINGVTTIDASLNQTGGDASTFSGNLSAKKLTSTDGVLELDDNGTHNGIINSPASLRINIDSNNDNTGESFQVANNATNIDGNNILFKVEESGNATFAGNIIANAGTSHSFLTGNTSNLSSADTTGFRLHQTSYTDGRYTHRFRKKDMMGGIPLYLDFSSGTANVFSNLVRFGKYSGEVHDVEVNGNIKATFANTTGYQIAGTYIVDSSKNLVNINNATIGGELTFNGGNVEGYVSYTIDMSNTSTYSVNKYYPVTIQGIGNGPIINLRIENQLNSNVPSWSTHNSGFSLVLDYLTNGNGWGTQYQSRLIRTWTERYANVTILGGISQMTNSSSEVLWLRGGGKYYLKANKAGLTVTPRSSTYTTNSQSVSPTADNTIENDVYSSAAGTMGISNIALNNKLQHSNDTHTYFQFAGDNDMRFVAGGTERMKITGDVHVQGTTDLNINGASRRLNFTSGTGTVRTTTENKLHLQTNSANAIVIDSSQKVGIGTDTPTTKLSVTDGATMYADSNYLVQIKRNSANGNDDTSKASILLANNSNGMQIAYGGTTDRLRFLDGGAVERFTMLNGGNVGIGAISPGEKLEVNGNIQSLDTILLKNSSSGVKWQLYRDGNETLNFRYNDASSWSANALSIKNNNKVGIGTYDPAGKLHISDTSTQLILETPNTTNDIDFRWRENGSNKWNMRFQNSGNHLQFLNQTGTSLTQLSLNADGESVFGRNVTIDSDQSSGSVVLDVSASAGQLFSVTNSLTGDLFSVADVSGIPILNVNSSGTVDIDGDLNLGYADKLNFGTSGNGLEIYSDSASNSYIKETGGSGALVFQSNDYYFQTNAAYTTMQITPNSGVVINATTSVGLTINADTDNATETDIPFLSFKMDGAMERLRIGVDASNNPYISTDSDSNLPLKILTGTDNGSCATFNADKSTTFAGDIFLTGGGTIEAPSSSGSEQLTFKAAGGVDFLIDSNGNSGDDQNFRIMKHTINSSSELLRVNESGQATFSGAVIIKGDATVHNGLYPDANYGAELGTTSLRFSNIRGRYCDLLQSSTSDPVLRLTDEGVANYDFTFPSTSEIRLSTGTTSTKTFKITNTGSGSFNLEVEGTIDTDGIMTADSFMTSGTGANIFLGSVISKPSGNTQGFILRNSSNGIIGQLRKDSDSASLLTCSVVRTTGNIGNLDTTNDVGQQLEVGSADYATLRCDANRWRVYMGGSGNSQETLTVTEAGRVGVKKYNPAYPLDVTGTMRATGDVIAFSDERVKENIKTIDKSLEKVNKLRGVEFNKIGEDKKSIGLIAQEIEKVLPEVVHTDDNGMKSVAYGNVVGILIEAIKELKAEIEECKSNKCNCK